MPNIHVFALFALVTALARGQQNVTVVAVDTADRLAGGTVLGEWAAAGNLDGWSGANVTGLAAAGGFLTGDDNSATLDASISRTAIAGGPDLDLGFNDYLQLRLKLPAAYAGDVKFEYGTTVNTGFNATRVFVLPAAGILKDGAFHTYRLSLGLEVFWRDFLRDLRITPLVAATGHFEIDYVEVGDVAGTAPALNLDTNFKTGLTAANTNRMESKHVCVWSDPADTGFTTVHARRALRMCEESYQVFCRKLGYNEPFREFDSTTTPRYKINFLTWYDGFWAGGYANRGHMNIGSGGLGDEGWGNPVPHEFGHVVQMAQPGNLDGGHWESHANYLRAGRNLHFYTAIPGCIPAIDNLTGNSNYRPDHNRHIYADQRYYLSLDDYGTQFGLPANYAATIWRDGASGQTLIEKLAPALPNGNSVKDVACECLKRWPMLDFVEKTRIRSQHWGTTANRAAHFWNQGAQLIPQQDKAGWWRVPLERAPDRWAYQMHDLTAGAGATITAEIRGLDMPGADEDWRWCFAAISAGDAVRYSPVRAPGTQSFTLTASETQVFLIVTATPNSTALDLGSLSNTKPVDKNPDRLRYAYEVRLVNATPAIHQYSVANPSGYHTHSNGGGIVGPSATVASTAYVGPAAKVVGSARVLGTARVEDYAVIQGSATVQGSAVVSGSALIEGNALVEGAARVRDRAHVAYGAAVRGRALISGYTHIENATVTDDAVVRGCAYPFGGTISGTAIMDHDYSMDWTVSSGVQFSHIPWGGWWDAFYAQTLRTPRGLIASYRTQEADGEQWWDEFGALHAQLRGSPLRAVDAAMGSAVLVLDGSNDYAALDRSVADTPRFSFSGWVKPGTAIGTAEPLLFLGSSATKAMKLVRNTTGQAVFTISDGTTTRTLTSTRVLPVNEWRNVAVTLDGGTGKLFIDGVAEATTTITLTPLTVLAANNGIATQANYIGRDWAGALFKGSCEDMRFYNVAMTAAEVLAEASRHGDLIGQFSPTAATDFNGTTTTAESGVRNGRVRTLSAWVKPRTSDDVSNHEAVFDSKDELGGGQGGGLGLDAGKWVARLDNVGNWATNVTATLGKWQHVALAFNGSTATLFINGVQAATRSYSGPGDDSAAAGKCYRIGFSQTSDDTATRQFFDGLILNARVHDRALTASQIVLDSDGDGVNDNVEADFGSNPLDAQSLPPQQTIAGKVTTTIGTAIAGVTVFFAEIPNSASNGTITATTDSNGNYSRGVTAGTWYVVAAGAGYNAGTERTLVVTTADLTGIDFSLAAYAGVGGRVTRRDGGSPISGASVYFSRSAGAANSPVFTATTNGNGDYTQALPDGLWYVAAGNPDSYISSDITLTLDGSSFGNINFSLITRSIPRTADLLFSAMTESLPASGATGNWPTYLPAGPPLAQIGSPTVEIVNGVKWVKNNRVTSNDGFRQGGPYTSIPCNGVTIVAAVKPMYCTPGGEPRGEIVDIMYDRLALAVSHTDGRIMVCRNYWNDWGPAIPDNTPVVLSLVVQPNGSYVVWSNGVQVMTGGADGDFSTRMVPTGTEGFKKYVNVGRNDPDGWSSFNGNIGDVFVYNVALTTAERQALEADVTARFVNVLANPATTLVRHSGTASSTTYGDSLVFDVTVSGTPTPTGTVTLKDGGAAGTTLGSASLAAGACTITPARNALTAGSHDNIVAVYSGDSHFFASTSSALDTQTVSQKELTVAGAAVTTRPYDGTTAATLSGTMTLNGVVGSDALTLDNAASGIFGDKHSRTGKSVGTTMTISGGAAVNYTLTQPTLTGTITSRLVTVAAVAATKTYDGTTAATGTPIPAPGLLEGDIATVLSQAFLTSTAGVGNKLIIPSITIDDGNGGANYAVTLQNFTTGTIHKATATVTLGVLAHNYDGTPKAATTTTDPAGLVVGFTYDTLTTPPSAAGSYAVVATVNETNYEGSANGTLVIVESIILWRESHFTPEEIADGLAADGVDPDGDGFSNLAEFTLGTDPRAYTPQPLAITPAAGNSFTLSFVARGAAGSGYAGLTRKYDIETSTDLANPNSWQAVAGQTNIVGADQTVVVTLPGDTPQKFHRLKVRLE